MIRTATAIGIRRYGRTALGSFSNPVEPLGSSWDGRSSRIRAFGAARWVGLGTEGALALVQHRLDFCVDEPHTAAIKLATDWISDASLARLQSPVILATGQRLIKVGSDGEIVEPADGIAAIGAAEAFIAGAAKAMSIYTSLNAEEIVRASLDLLADGITPSSAAFSVEWV